MCPTTELPTPHLSPGNESPRQLKRIKGQGLTSHVTEEWDFLMKTQVLIACCPEGRLAAFSLNTSFLFISPSSLLVTSGPLDDSLQVWGLEQDGTGKGTTAEGHVPLPPPHPNSKQIYK